MLKDNYIVLVFSLALSFLTILVTEAADSSLVESIPPITEDIRSPYRDEINRLLEKAKSGISPSESSLLSELMNKNNEWYEKYNAKNIPRLNRAVSLSFSELHLKTTMFLFLIWLLLSLIIEALGRVKHIFLALVFPTVIALLGLISFYNLTAIWLAITLVWLWAKLRDRL